MRFARAVLDRPYKFTVVFLALNFFVFLLMWQSSGMSSGALWEFPLEVLLAYGAKLNFLIKEHHEWWRLLTPMFLHAGLLHLLVNMYALWMLGPYVEKLYGSAKFVVFWVVSGFAGVVASYLTVASPGAPVRPLLKFIIKTQDNPSVGASGALFGLVGVLFIFGIKFRHELPEGFKRAFGTGLIPMIALNLFIGYLGRGLIDNAAHLGGMIAGAALAAFVDYRRPGERGGVALTWRILQVLSLGILVVSFFKIATHFSSYTRPAPEPVVTSRSIFYFKAFNYGQEALDRFLHEATGDQLEPAILQLNALPPAGERTDTLRERLKEVLRTAKELDAFRVSDPKPPSKEIERRESDLVKEFAVWKADYEQWLKTDAKNLDSVQPVPESTPQ